MVTKVRTLDFLPDIFRTTPNKQFLSATLDQLVQQPNTMRIQGYVGRKFESGINSNDSYVPEPTKIRTDYQLEPAVIFTKPDVSTPYDFISYPEIIDALKLENSPVKNNSSLFNNQFYSWDSFVDLDKLINFNQYYWLPNGPDTVEVAPSNVDFFIDYVVDDNITNAYQFTADGELINENNPMLTLLRGGTYTFRVKQNSNFWIQTLPGVTGLDPQRINSSTRNVYGVANNGISDGIVTFSVPSVDAQAADVYPGNHLVDLVTTLPFASIHGQLLSDIGSIDGITILNGKTVMFYGFPSGSVGEITKLYSDQKYDQDTPVVESFDEFNQTDMTTTFYRIVYREGDQIGNPVLTLEEVGSIPTNEKITAIYGTQYSNVNFVKNPYGIISIIPLITAPSSVLYYQDGTDAAKFGVIKLIENLDTNYIDVDLEILGKKTYLSPNGVKFTNGLKVNFSGNVIPSSYQNGDYYVEGVGTAIQLLPTSNFDTPESYTQQVYSAYDYEPFDMVNYGATLNVPIAKDYITINRKAENRNAWSRSNRWFHVGVLQEVIKHSTATSAASAINSEASRAKRPVIEFYPNLKLFDSGTIGKQTVDFIDFNATDALTDVAGHQFNIDTFAGVLNQTTFTLSVTPEDINYISAVVNGITLARSEYILVGADVIFNVAPEPDAVISVTTSYYPDGVDFPLFHGCTIVFANDTTEYIRNTIYLVDFISVTGSSAPIISLSKVANGDVLYDDQIVINLGQVNKGKSFYSTGLGWNQAQEKTNVNQPPLFDIFDKNGLSLSDASYYVGTDFIGCTLFEYATGTGANDPVLGFPLKYSAVNNIGDIGFNVSLNENTFNYVVNGKSITSPINIGYPYIFDTRETYTRQLGWQTTVGDSFQYQAFDFEYNPEKKTNAVFVCDVPAKSSDSTAWPTVRVIINATVLLDGEYTVSVNETETTVTLVANPIIITPVQVLVYSDSVGSKNSYYTVPTNLSNNPFNAEMKLLSLGDIRGHYQSICVNSNQIQGIMFGPNNYRDLGNLVPFGNKIIQSSAPMPLTGAFLRNKNFSLIDSLSYSSDEYIKFKTALIDTVSKSSYSVLQSSASILDDAMDQLSSYKSEENAFFWSDMIPNRAATITNTYKFNALVSTTYFPLSRIYDFDSANYYGVLLYLTRITNGATNTTQLVKGIDYIVSSTEPKVTVFTDLVPSDLITINEYNQTYGSFVPNTPAKLGFITATVPMIVLETTYLTPTYFIRGHDNSLTKLYGSYNNGLLQDFRDRALFEFELRIYNNLKVNAEVPVAIDEVFPGQFRTTDFSYEEVMNLYSTCFLNWVGKNRIDYKTQYYLTNDEYTWNYNQSANVLDNTQFKQGNWKGIYNWFYDTVTPATTPWEMLGYKSKPLWWDSRYGEAPYTSDNMLLWDDMELGFDYNGGASRILPNKARPGLTKVLPVDSEGNQVGPMEAVVGNYDSLTFNRDWRVGDVGPAEYSYLNSSSWPFDLMKILALCKPAQFFALGQNLDVYKYNVEFNQYLVNDRFRLSTVDTVAYGSGIAQHSYMDWIVDYVQSTGATGFDKLGELLRNLDVRLVYRLAGFSDKDLLNFYVERTSSNKSAQGTNTTMNNNSLLIPNESFSVLLHDNQPFSTIQYSGVIVQKTQNGYAVYGNSQNKIYFRTLVPLVNGNYSTIDVADLKVFVSKNYSTAETIVPYGTEFKSPQALAQFIASYGKFLADQGILFENIENSIVVDWNQIIAEVLYWIQSGWEVGAIINVNPVAKNLIIDKPSSIVQPLTIQNQNFILNQNLVPIQLKDMSINRDGTVFNAIPLNDGDTISYVAVNLGNIEHAVVFDNTTLFNDLIFDPTTGLRQNRVLAKGIKTAEWDGTLDTQGFILNQDNIQEWATNTKYTKGIIVKYKNNYWISNAIIQANPTFEQEYWVKTDYEKIQKGLLPNASTRAYEASLYYNTESSNLESDADLLSYSLIGYRPRPYLAAANLDDISQVNLYKTFIVEKGTKNSVSAIQGITLATGSINFTAYENWAIKVGQYGGVLNQNFIEFRLNENLLTGNPNIVGIVGSEKVNNLMQEVPLYSLSNYNQPITSTEILPLLPPDTLPQLPSAGYVNFDDITISSYSFSGLNTNIIPISEFYKNEYVWLANHKGIWNVYTPIPLMSSGFPVKAVSAINNLNDTTTLVFDNPHGMVQYDMFMVINYDSLVDGFYEVVSVSGNNSVVINLSLPQNTQSLTSVGIVAKFESQRVATPKDIDTLTLINSEFVKNKVWVDNSQDGGWAVYQKSINYSILPNFTKPPVTETFGSSVAYSSTLGYFVGDQDAGKVYQYFFNDVIQSFVLNSTFTNGVGFGAAIANTDTTLVITEPNVSSSTIYVYTLESAGTIKTVVPQQQITISGTKAGDAIALSGDSNWLYVSSLTDHIIRVYTLNTNPTFTSSGLVTTNLIVAGGKFFKVSGNHTADFMIGSTISFSNVVGSDSYKINAIQYDADANDTTYYVNGTFATAASIGATIYKVTVSYSSAGSFTVSGTIASDNFGYSISTNYNGNRVFVSAPNTDYSISFTDTGTVYAFDRIVQVFEHRYNTLPDQPTVFTLAWTPVLTPTITLNGRNIASSKYTVVGNTLSVLVQVNAGDLVEVSSSDFVHTKTIVGYSETETPRVGILFGHSIDNNQSASEFIIGAPFDISVDNVEGSVYRFTSGGKKYGIITSIAPAVLTNPITILLNGFAVTLPAGNAGTCVTAINNANIPNVTASQTSDFKLVIQLVDPELNQVNNKLTITVFDKSAFSALGVIEYERTQVLHDSTQSNATQFGFSVKFNEFNSFVVSAPISTRFTSTVFDFIDDSDYTNDTLFDNNFTVWIDDFTNAGSVYMFDYLPSYNESITNTGKFILAQTINDTNTSIGPRPYYGKSLAFNGSNVLVGGPDYFSGTINGSFTAFHNTSNQVDWSIYRTSGQVVDINKLHTIQLYDNTTNNTLTTLDFIDPLQGKLFGVVRENLDFISNIDPAGYNTEVRNTRIVWSGEFVGKLWFNTTNTRFVDYHQTDVVYNSQYWGTVFPGSDVAVYTWIESDVVPFNYTGLGTPFSFSSFTTVFDVDNTGAIVTKYYYWVRDTTSILDRTNKTLTDSTIASYIANPSAAGISFFAPYKPNVFGIYNSIEYINSLTTSIHIGFKSGNNNDPMHSEFQLIRDGYADDFLSGIPTLYNSVAAPENLYEKLLDSISGVDKQGQILPNPYLPNLLKTGVLGKPRQSFFIDRLTALKNYISYANRVLAQYPITEMKNSTFLNLNATTNAGAGAPSLFTASGLYFDTNDYWDYTYWWATGFNSNTRTDLEVPKYYDLATLTPFNNMVVGVLSNSDGKREVYQYSETENVWNRVGLQQGTIRIKDSLWDYETTRIGFGEDFFDTRPFDSYPSTETYYIIRGLNEEVYTENLLIHRNQSLILLFEYIVSENIESQNYLPWINKTSLMNVQHTLRELTESTAFQRDDATFLEGYLNEVKPYHVVIKEFSLRYTKTDLYQNNVTDFDLPAEYNTAIERFITPELVFTAPSGDNQFYPTDAIWQDSDYDQWYNNFGLSLTGISNYPITKVRYYLYSNDNEIQVDNAFGFPITGLIKIDQEIIGYSNVDRDRGILLGLSRGLENTQVTSHFFGAVIYIDLPGVIVYNTGRNYIDPPVITAYIDTNMYPAPRVLADIRPIMSGGQVVGATVVNPGSGYSVTPELLVSSAFSVSFDSTDVNYISNTINVTSGELVIGDIVRYDAGTGRGILGLEDGKFYYVSIPVLLGLRAARPTIAITLHISKADALAGTHAVTLIQGAVSTGNTLSVTARMVPIVTNLPIRQLTTTLKFDRTSYFPKVTQWIPGEFYASYFNSLGNDASSSLIQMEAVTFTDQVGQVFPSGGYGATFDISNLLLNGTWFVDIVHSGVEYSVGDLITNFSINYEIAKIDKSFPARVTTKNPTQFVTGILVGISGVVGMAEIQTSGVSNTNQYYIKVESETTFLLYASEDLSVPVDSTHFLNSNPNTGTVQFDLADCAIDVVSVNILGEITEVNITGTPWKVYSSSLQGAVLPITAISSEDVTGDTIITVNYVPSTLTPGVVKNAQLYFYDLPAPYTYHPITGAATIVVSNPRFDGMTVSKQYAIDIKNPGTIYNSGDVITISGTLLGGTSPSNDLVITITFADAGAIVFYTLSGLANSIVQQYYVYPINSTQLKVYQDPALKLAIPNTIDEPFGFSSGSYAFLPEPISGRSTYRFSVESFVAYNHKIYRCIVGNNDMTFDYAKWEEVSSDSTDINALDRVVAYYQPSINMPGNNLPMLMSGLDYPNNTYLGNKFDPELALPLDTILKDQPFYPKDITITSVLFDGVRYFAVGNTPGNSVILNSNDGLIWNVKKLSSQPLGVTDITYSGSFYVISTTNTNTPLLVSYDATNWISVGTFTPFDTTGFGDTGFDSTSVQSPYDSLNAVINHNNTFVSVGLDILTSDSVLVWKQAFTFASTLNNILNAVAYVNTNFTGYVAVGNGEVVTSAPGSAFPTVSNVARIMISYNSVIWNSVTINEASALNTVFSSDSLIIIAGDNGVIYYSSNGQNWTPSTINGPTVTDNLNSGIYISGQYILVGDSGTILYSFDGITWEQTESVSVNNLRKVISVDGIFTAVGDSGTILRSENAINWVDASYITTDPTFYVVQGDAFTAGYGPEELVAGVIYDHLSMTVITTPGSLWTPESFEHCGFNMIGTTIVPDFTGIFSFDNIVTNPVQLAVYVVNQLTHLGRRIYQDATVSATNPITYSIDWIAKTITLNTGIAADEAIFLEMYEIGGGNQEAKGTTDSYPLQLDQNLNVSFIDTHYVYSEVVTDPVVYLNGELLTYNTDYALYPNSVNDTNIVFATQYSATDFISFALLGNTIITGYESTQFGYSVPQTQVFDYAGSAVFTLSYYVGSDNPINAVVELNGLRLIETTDYTIDDITNELTVTATLTTDDIISITTFNDTTEQSLVTDYSSSLLVTPIYYIDNSRTPLVLITASDPGFITGDQVTIDGLEGSAQLQNSSFYVKMEPSYIFEAVTYYPMTLFLDNTLVNPVKGPSTQNYVSSGFIWKTSQTVQLTQPSFDVTNPERLFVTVNGERVNSGSLRMNAGNYLNIMSPIEFGDEIIVTSMIPSATPNELTYNMLIDKTGAAEVYRANSNNRTWLTQPLYTTQDSMTVYDVKRLVDSITVDTVIELVDSRLVIQLPYVITDIKQVSVYDTSKLINVPTEDFILVSANSETIVVFLRTVDEGDNAVVTVRFGDTVMINGEKIAFNEIDYTTNTISKLTRGIDGTAVQQVQPTNSAVYSLAPTDKLSDFYYNKTWNSDNFSAVGDPLQLSDTYPAEFLKS